MPPSRRKRVRNSVAVFHDDPSEGDDCRDITIKQSAAGRVFHSTVMVGEPKAGTSNCTGPWADGFFEKNTKAFIVDSLPEEPIDFDTPDLQLDSNEDVKDRPKVLAAVSTTARFTD